MFDFTDLILLNESNEIIEKCRIKKPNSYNELLNIIDKNFELQEDYIIFYKYKNNDEIQINNNEDFLSSKGLIFIRKYMSINKSLFTYNYDKLPESKQNILDEKYICPLCEVKIKNEKPLFCYICQKIFHKDCLKSWEKKRISQNLKFNCPSCRNETSLNNWKEKLDYIDNRKNEEEVMDKISKYELDKTLNININNIYENEINELTKELKELNKIKKEYIEYKEFILKTLDNILIKINEINSIIEKDNKLNVINELPQQNDKIKIIFDSLEKLENYLKKIEKDKLVYKNEIKEDKKEDKQIKENNIKEENLNVNRVNDNIIINEGKGINQPPSLLSAKEKIVEKLPKSITSYQFYDNEQYVVVKIELTNFAQNVTEQDIIYDFKKKAFNLTILASDDIYYFSLNKLYLDIIPQNSNVKIIKNKEGKKFIKINLAKVDIKKEWSKLIE